MERETNNRIPVNFKAYLEQNPMAFPLARPLLYENSPARVAAVSMLSDLLTHNLNLQLQGLLNSPVSDYLKFVFHDNEDQQFIAMARSLWQRQDREYLARDLCGFIHSLGLFAWKHNIRFNALLNQDLSEPVDKFLIGNPDAYQISLFILGLGRIARQGVSLSFPQGKIALMINTLLNCYAQRRTNTGSKYRSMSSQPISQLVLALSYICINKMDDKIHVPFAELLRLTAYFAKFHEETRWRIRYAVNIANIVEFSGNTLSAAEKQSWVQELQLLIGAYAADPAKLDSRMCKHLLITHQVFARLGECPNLLTEKELAILSEIARFQPEALAPFPHPHMMDWSVYYPVNIPGAFYSDPYAAGAYYDNNSIGYYPAYQYANAPMQLDYQQQPPVYHRPTATRSPVLAAWRSQPQQSQDPVDQQSAMEITTDNKTRFIL